MRLFRSRPQTRLRWGALLAWLTRLAFVPLLPAAEPQPPVPRPHSFRSAITGREVHFDILLPPDHSDSATNRYPVVYWLPDSPPVQGSPGRFGLAPAVVHDAIQQHIIPPLVVVYVRDGSETFYTDAATGLTPSSSTLVLELVPAVDRAVRTLPTRSNRSVLGLGRGGFGALRFGLLYPDTFGAAGGFSGAFHSAEAFTTNATLRPTFVEAFATGFDHVATNHPVFLVQSQRDRVRLRSGFRLTVSKQGPFLSENRLLRDQFRSQRVPVEWTESSLSLPVDQPLPESVARDALEFVASWLETARSPDADGPWVNTPTNLPPRLQHHTVYSPILERPVGYSLYLPPGGESNRTASLPVIYHLHGRGEDETAHLETTGYLDTAVRLGEVAPCAWVWLYGGRNSWFMDTADGKVLAESAFLEEIVPAIEARWNLGGSPARRALDGWGMGGFGAVRYAGLAPPFFGAALLHNPLLPNLAVMPERYPDAWVSVFNADTRRFTQIEPFGLLTRNAPALKSVVRFRIVAGQRSPSQPDAARLRTHLESLGLPVEYSEVPAAAGTGPDLYRSTGLQDLQFLWKALTRPEDLVRPSRPETTPF